MKSFDRSRNMGWYDSKKNVKEYIKMAEGYDGKVLIVILKKFLPKGSTVLELGMGPGKDLNLLKRYYVVTGSDISKIFLDLYKKNNRLADLLLLDAATIKTDRKFDCIYSNKVLHHLSKTELKESLKKQNIILKKDGILFHSFWKGCKEEKKLGLKFVYYTKKELTKMIDNTFEILQINEYGEMEDNDSIYLILKKK